MGEIKQFNGNTKVCGNCVNQGFKETLEETIKVKPNIDTAYVANAVEQRKEFNDEIKPKKKRFFNR